MIVAEKFCQIIILGAGPPHRGETPTALRETHVGPPVLNWVLEALNARIQDVTFVAGYQAKVIKSTHPELPVVENPYWKSTGSAASLLLAPFSEGSDLLVCYSDILFRPRVVEKLKSSEAPVTIVWDSEWKRRYAGRGDEDMLNCEKVLVVDGRVSRLGADIPLDWASGEFVGLVRFNAQATTQLLNLKQHLPDSLQKVHISGMLEYLRAQGMEIRAIDVAGDWAEVDEPRDIAHFVLGTKAETLSRLQGMVSGALIQNQVSFTVSQWREEPDSWIARIRERFAGKRVVVRSSAINEDSFSTANAGAYTSLLDVDPDTGLKEAVERVISSYRDVCSGRDQILVQPMLSDVTLSGVAFTRTLNWAAPWYVINYETKGDTEEITSGSSKEHQTLMIRRGTGLDSLPVKRLKPVVYALQEIEGLLGFDSLDVEFALDSRGRVHVLQVRPIVASAANGVISDEDCHQAIEAAKKTWTRLAPCPPHLPDGGPLFGLMPDWNPAEIIGTSPGALAESLYRYLIMDEIWAAHRAEFGYRDVRPGPLLAGFSGRPYVDVRTSFASFIPASVPDELAGRLLKFYLDWLRIRPHLHDKVEFEVVPTCLAPGFERWEKRLMEQGGLSREDMAILRNGLHQVTVGAFDRTEHDLFVVAELKKRFSAVQANQELDPLERSRVLLDDCRRYGTLPFCHLARCGFIAATLLRSAQEVCVISREARDGFLSSVRTISHELTSDARATARGEMAWEDFVPRYGHLRPGTYDITSPRYDSDPERFLRPLVEHACKAEPEVENIEPWLNDRDNFFHALHDLGLPSESESVENFLRSAIQGRECAKFVFTRNLSAALESLAEFAGKEFNMNRQDLAHIPLEAVLALRDSSRPGYDPGKHLHEMATSGRRAKAIAGACEMPPLITAEQDLDAFVLGSDLPNFIGAAGVTAECIDLAKANQDLKTELSGRIVLIPQADPGYDWLFGQGICGLITLYGGANSHMAIRAAEFGLPAAIGVGEQRYQKLAGAEVIELDPGNHILRVLR